MLLQNHIRGRDSGGGGRGKAGLAALEVEVEPRVNREDKFTVFLSQERLEKSVETPGLS